MKRYLIFVFSVLFGLAQLAQAANPNDVKKGKKAPQAQAVGKAQKHVGQPPAAFKKSSNVSNRMVRAPAYHQVNQHAGKPPAAFKKSANVQRRVVQTPAYHPVNTNQVNKKFQQNQRTLARQNNANVQLQKKVNNHNAAVAAQNARRMNQQQKNATIAAQNAAQLRNQQQHNNGAIAAQNAQRLNNQNVNRGNWNGLSFSDAYRRRDRGRHHRDWWRSHYGTNFSLFGGGYYYWDSGYWYPAYGYDPAYSTYEYDGPIYGYNNLPPGDVVTNVQSALQEQGYYRGEIDGSIGPLTRAALRRYQRDNGLEITAAVDQPTLASLGLT
jgi:hypothetical protein